jgi:hypothetical protein
MASGDEVDVGRPGFREDLAAPLGGAEDEITDESFGSVALFS